ncbi:hypothetical protein P9112_003843 [Eukaryota sp. TZLM1-RC]
MESQNVDLSTLPPEALESIVKQTEQEISILRSSIVQLRSAQSRFRQSKDSLDQLNTTEPDSEMLVPLTDSLYVPGRSRDTSKVLVEIGTGYYAERKVDQAKGYFSRKVKYLDGRIKELSEAHDQKNQLLNVSSQLLRQHQQAASQKSQ